MIKNPTYDDAVVDIYLKTGTIIKEVDISTPFFTGGFVTYIINNEVWFLPIDQVDRVVLYNRGERSE
jgi:allantoicase